MGNLGIPGKHCQSARKNKLCQKTNRPKHSVVVKESLMSIARGRHAAFASKAFLDFILLDSYPLHSHLSLFKMLWRGGEGATLANEHCKASNIPMHVGGCNTSPNFTYGVNIAAVIPIDA